MVILMLLELDHPHCKSVGVRKSYINFLMSCQEEYILFHMLTVKARAFTDKELIDLALKLIRHSSRDTIRLAGGLATRLPTELLTAMKEFND